MPIRKSQSSDAPPPTDSHRTSMRRLSSIASLQQLNPFNRRRSNNNTDDSPCCSSNISLQSTSATTATTSDSRKPSNSSMLALGDNSMLAEPSPLESQASFLRRSSYVCLPDDPTPMGGMPRSRTFSNLPIPSRTKKNASRAPSISHIRNTSGFTPSTRLPSPPASTRRHIPGSIPAAAARAHKVNNRMQRSDTMPLLSYRAEGTSVTTRPETMEEKAPSSPSKIAQKKEHFDEAVLLPSLPAGSYMEDQAWETETLTALPRQPSFSGTLPVSRYAVNPATRENQKFFSSPTYTNSRGHHQSSSVSTRGQPVQRWSSQPILTNATNLQPSNSTRRHEIKQTRLMSARQAPTPPPPRTPLNAQALTANPLVRSSTSTHFRTPSSQSPLNPGSSPPSVLPPNALQVTNAEPPAYWCGRVSALLDRYRNEDLSASAPSFDGSTRLKSETDVLHTPATNTARLRKALEHLYAQCITEEARESFNVFQLRFAMSQKLPELARPIPVARPAEAAARPAVRQSDGAIDTSTRKTSDGEREAEAGSSARSRRVHNLFDRMLGRKDKRVSNV